MDNIVEIPPVRTQQMGLCSVQMVRLIDEPTPLVIKKPGQLFWTTPETDEAIKGLMEGPDVTKQSAVNAGSEEPKSECAFTALNISAGISVSVGS